MKELGEAETGTFSKMNLKEPKFNLRSDPPYSSIDEILRCLRRCYNKRRQ